MKKSALKQFGFTLIELLIAISVIGILIAFIYPELSGSKQATLFKASETMLTKTFPDAIARQLAYSNSCTGMTKTNITDLGVEGNSPFGDAWTVSVSGSVVTVTMPLSSAAETATIGPKLATNVGASKNTASSSFTTPNIVTRYSCL